MLDGIGSLLDKSLLHRETGMYGDARYAMLETVREYGLERVALTGEIAMLHARHASCYLRIIQEAEVTELHPVHIQLLHQIDDDIHNIRAALAWAKEHDVQAALLFTATLLGWFHERGLLTEGQRLIDEVLALPGAHTRTIPRAKMLSMVAFFLSCVNKIAEAQSFAEESLDLSQRTGLRQRRSGCSTSPGANCPDRLVRSRHGPQLSRKCPRHLQNGSRPRWDLLCPRGVK